MIIFSFIQLACTIVILVIIWRKTRANKLAEQQPTALDYLSDIYQILESIERNTQER